MKWEIVYVELLNKLRWTLRSTFENHGLKYPSKHTMEWASYLAGTVLAELKGAEELQAKMETGLQESLGPSRPEWLNTRSTAPANGRSRSSSD